MHLENRFKIENQFHQRDGTNLNSFRSHINTPKKKNMVRFAGHYIKNNQYTKPMNRSVCTMGFVAFWREKKSKAHERKFGLCCNREKDKRIHTQKKKHTNEWTEKQSQKLIFHKLRTKKKHDTQKKTRSIILFAPFFHVDNKVRSRQMSNEILNRSDRTPKIVDNNNRKCHECEFIFPLFGIVPYRIAENNDRNPFWIDCLFYQQMYIFFLHILATWWYFLFGKDDFGIKNMIFIIISTKWCLLEPIGSKWNFILENIEFFLHYVNWV